jgi:RNA polymerase sigma factor (sigma-70 family)
VTDERIDGLFREHRAAILAYLARRAAAPEDAADLLAETFIVALRRPEHIPEGIEARLWLFGVARRVLANHQRGVRRRDAAVERLAGALRIQVAAAPPAAADMIEMRQQLARLAPDDRELLTLIAWDGLTPTEAADVLDLNPATARGRLMRARRRLRAALDRSDEELTNGARLRRRQATAATRANAASLAARFGTEQRSVPAARPEATPHVEPCRPA